MTLPQGFTDMIRSLLKEEADAFLHAMQMPPEVSVRVNSRKPGAEFQGAEKVKWCPTGYYLPERPIFTLDPLLHAGAYYVQDASSMIYREATSRILNILTEECHDVKPPSLQVLDMCAAPGGKTTAVIDAVPDGSRVTANEYVAKRVGILKENLTKWGYPDVTVTNHDSSFFAVNGYTYDIVAVDAPCSGEGMMRKDETARKQWCTALVEQCASLQREILTNAAECVKPGGFLIYSTCTFNRQENEENAEFIASQLGLNPYDLEFPPEWGIAAGIGTALPVSRFMPHKTKGEGLFLAVFRKPGQWMPSSQRAAGGRRIQLNKVKKGVARETHQRKMENVPPIEEVLSVGFDRTRFPEAELTEPQAVAYLRREAVILPPDVARGLVTVTYRGLPLGMVKNIGSRANNLYPKGWRILMQ